MNSEKVNSKKTRSKKSHLPTHEKYNEAVSYLEKNMELTDKDVKEIKKELEKKKVKKAIKIVPSKKNPDHIFCSGFSRCGGCTNPIADCTCYDNMSDDAIEQINEYEEKYYTEKYRREEIENENEILKDKLKILEEDNEKADDSDDEPDWHDTQMELITERNDYKQKYEEVNKELEKSNRNGKNYEILFNGLKNETDEKIKKLEDGKVQLEKIVATAVQKSLSQLKIIKKLENEVKSKIQLSSESESESHEDHFTEPHDDWNYADYEINYRKLLFYFNEQKEEYKGAEEEINGLKDRLKDSKEEIESIEEQRDEARQKALELLEICKYKDDEITNLKFQLKRASADTLKLNTEIKDLKFKDLKPKINKLINMMEEYEALGAIEPSMKWTLQYKLETFLNPDYKPTVDYPRHIINLGNGEFY